MSSGSEKRKQEQSVNHFSLTIRNAGFCQSVLILTVTAVSLLPFGRCRTCEAQWVQSRTAQAEEISDEDVVSTGRDQRTPEYILDYRGIEPTVDGIREYLQSMQPDHPMQKTVTEQARGLIKKLGSESYRERRAAREQLAKMPTLPVIDLRAARTSGDPEVRASAAMILEYAKKRAPKDSLDGITTAVCKTIVENEIKGLTNDLLSAIGLFDNPNTIIAIQDAVVVSATEGDIETFHSIIGQDQLPLRIAALGGLVNVQKEKCTAELVKLLTDDDEIVRMFVARELANMGVRDSIKGLIGLMESEDLAIRLKSNRVLRAVTGQNFKFFAFEKPESRIASLKQWEEWLAGDGASAELQFPLMESEVVLGRILLSDYSAGKVVELNMEGEVTWEKEVGSPWAVEGLPNGHRLVGLYEPSAIVEFDAEGKEVWRVDGVPGNVMGISRMENGNTLAACSSADKVVEYDQAGEIIWEKEISGRPTDIKHLDNGNMLVTLMNPSQVIEINRAGERIWELDTDSNPLQAQRTSRGTTIIAHSSMSAAVEYDLDGKEVRRIELPGTITAAREMANGDFVLSTSDAVRRQSPDGTVVWEYKDLTYCYNVSPY